MDSTVHTKTISIHFCFDPLSRVFSKVYGLDENDQRVSVDGRPKHIKMHADSNKNVLV